MSIGKDFHANLLKPNYIGTSIVRLKTKIWLL